MVRPASGNGSQSGVYFVRYDGATGQATAPSLSTPNASGHQVYPDIAADGGILHALWWDSRNDPCYSADAPDRQLRRPETVPSLDVYATRSTDAWRQLGDSAKSPT